MTDLLDRTQSHLLIVDIQERLLPSIPDHERVVSGCARLLEAAHLLSVGTTLSEHYPKGLGRTPSVIRDHLAEDDIFEKTDFCAVRDPRIRQRFDTLKLNGSRQVVVAGLEAHLCVLQTSLGLLSMGLAPFVVVDATSSRTGEQADRAWARLQQAGVVLVDSDMVFFEWLERAGTDDFRTLLPLIKQA